MRLAVRMGFVFTAVGAAVFVLHGRNSVQREALELAAVVQEETHTIANSLAVSVGNALRDAQLDDAERLLATLAVTAPRFHASLLTASGEWRTSSREPGEPPEELRALLTRVQADGVPYEARLEGDEGARLLFVLPVEGGEGRVAALAVERRLADIERWLAGVRVRSATAGMGATIIFGLLAVLLGSFSVSLPLMELVEAMRFVREGDLTTRLRENRDDELGSAARQFNAMADQLASARRALEQEQEQREDLLSALQHADKLVTVGQLASGLAHEIATPLHILSGRARALRDHPPAADEVARVAGQLVEQTDRISRIVRQLLDYAGRRPRTEARAAVMKPVEAVLDLLAHDARKRGVALEADIADDIRSAKVSPDELQQIALNLVRNALAATPSGGRIVVELSASEMTLPGDRAPLRALRLRVKDTGTGIAPEDAPYVFEPFFTTRAHDGGSGLGLAVTRSLVLAQGGTISFSDAPSGGTCFEVMLPLDQIEVASA